MGNKARQGTRPASGNGAGFRVSRARAAFDRELFELERQKLVTLRGGTIQLTREGYDAIVKRFPRGRS